MRSTIAIGAVLFLLPFEVNAEGDEMDPTVLAPHIYEIILENEKVRVLNVTVRPKEVPPTHSHPDRVVVYVDGCSAESINLSFDPGEAIWLAAETHGGVPTPVDEQCKVIEVEVK